MGNFNSRQSIDKMVKKGLKRTDSRISVKEVCDIFGITDARSHLPIQQVGNDDFDVLQLSVMLFQNLFIVSHG